MEDLVDVGGDVGEKLAQGFRIQPPVGAVGADDDALQPGLQHVVDFALHVVDLVIRPDEIAGAGADHGDGGHFLFGGQHHERPCGGQAAEREGGAEFHAVGTAVDGGEKAKGAVDADFEQGHGGTPSGVGLTWGGVARKCGVVMEGVMADERLIVALDVADALTGMELADRIGDACGFYKIGLGMLTGGGLALARELKDEKGKRIFLDMKLFDIGATVEAAVRGLARFDLDFLTVHGDPHVVRAAKDGAGASGMKILAVTVLTSLDRGIWTNACIRRGRWRMWWWNGRGGRWRQGRTG